MKAIAFEIQRKKSQFPKIYACLGRAMIQVRRNGTSKYVSMRMSRYNKVVEVRGCYGDA